MFHKVYSIGGTLIIALVMAVVTPAPAQAAGHGGGGHGGGFHGGGFHGGGHFGGFRGGSHFGGFHGGFNRGFSHFGHSRPFGFRHYGYSPYYGGGYYSYPSYGYYPYSYGYYPSYSYDDSSGSYDDSSAVVVPDDSDTSLSPTIGQAAPAQTDTRAFVTLKAPADAVVSFNGVKMSTTGTVREYSTPALTPGQRYAYEVRASWQEGGQTVTQTQSVPITAGAHPTVTFPVARTGSVTNPH